MLQTAHVSPLLCAMVPSASLKRSNHAALSVRIYGSHVLGWRHAFHPSLRPDPSFHHMTVVT